MSRTTAAIARAKKVIPAIAKQISHSRDVHHTFWVRRSACLTATGSRRMRDGRGCSSRTVFLPSFNGSLIRPKLRAIAYFPVSALAIRFRGRRLRLGRGGGLLRLLRLALLLGRLV